MSNSRARRRPLSPGTPSLDRAAETSGLGAPESGREASESVGVPSLTADPGGEWRAVAVSVQGASHQRSGGPCQDAHYLITDAGGVLLAAVADGAGSADQSHIGAEIASRVAVLELQRWRNLALPCPESDEEWACVMKRALAAARDAVAVEAERLGLMPRDLASTLIVVQAVPGLVVVGQVGDGAAVIATREEQLSSVTTPQSGEYLNETTFLISPDAVEQAQTAVWRGDVQFLSVFSDGLQMLALRMSDGTPHLPFFAPLFQFVRDQPDMDEAQNQLRAFLTSARITDRADDDLTLLLAEWR